jgi:hypothetical protein
MHRPRAIAMTIAVVGAFLIAPTAANAATVTYEAENATISQGAVNSDHAGFTGTGFVNYDNLTGSYVQWPVSVAADGSTTLTVRFANGTTTARPMTIAVDGTTVATPSFAGTGAWTTWATTAVTATLTAGAHTVRATATTANGGPNVDSLIVGDSGGGSGAPSASELLSKLTACSQISSGKYKTDSETSRTIPVCGLSDAVFWKADMDIDCDGQRTSQCNENTDCCFQADTAFHQSDGKPLNAAALPYVVVPSPSSTWDYRKFGIAGAGVVAVIYNNQVTYAVVGDTGPTDIIGEASYATASSLGINPDPSNGGTDSGVTYLFFKNSKVTPIESHANAVSTGEALARQFVNNH